jgi:hypothetical protein
VVPEPIEPSAQGPVFGELPLPEGANTLYATNIENTSGSGITASITPTSPKKRAYLTSAVITSATPSAVAVGTVTISDGVWTLKYQFVETVSAGGCLNLGFVPPLVASAANSAITVTVPPISGGATAAIAAAGFEL